MGLSVGRTSVASIGRRVTTRPRALAAALALAAVVAFAGAFWLGRATSDPRETQARAIPIRQEQRSVEVVGLGDAARVPALRPPRRTQRPVVIVGQG
jgi:hypothetical protein